MNRSPRFALIHDWFNEYVRMHLHCNELLQNEPFFRQIDSFAIIEFLLACDEAFGLGESLGNDALTLLTPDEITAFIAAKASKMP